MRATLKFELEGVKRLMEQTRKATSWRKTWDGKATGPGLDLVHDEGVYLMSTDRDQKADPETKRYPVVYAVGCNPFTDGDVWEHCRTLVGGDDFSEYLPFEVIDSVLQRPFGGTPRYLIVKVSPRQFSFALGR